MTLRMVPLSSPMAVCSCLASPSSCWCRLESTVLAASSSDSSATARCCARGHASASAAVRSVAIAPSSAITCLASVPPDSCALAKASFSDSFSRRAPPAVALIARMRTARCGAPRLF
eukprot:6807205-Prymnesium_polylepis.2